MEVFFNVITYKKLLLGGKKVGGGHLLAELSQVNAESGFLSSSVLRFTLAHPSFRAITIAYTQPDSLRGKHPRNLV